MRPARKGALMAEDQPGREGEIPEKADVQHIIPRAAVIAPGVHIKDGVGEGTGEGDQLRDQKHHRGNSAHPVGQGLVVFQNVENEKEKHIDARKKEHEKRKVREIADRDGIERVHLVHARGGEVGQQGERVDQQQGEEGPVHADGQSRPPEIEDHQDQQDHGARQGKAVVPHSARHTPSSTGPGLSRRVVLYT